MKKIIAIIIAAMMCLVVTACGDKNSAADESAAAETSASTPAATIASGTQIYDTIEDYINTPDVRNSIDRAKEENSDVFTFEYHVEGDTLVYDYTYVKQVDSSALESVKAAQEKSLDSNSDHYSQVVEVLRKNVKADAPKLTINYHNNDGSVIASRTFE